MTRLCSQVAWSADSRLFCSGSKDSTLKVWDVRSKKLLMDLPGHADEVFRWGINQHVYGVAWFISLNKVLDIFHRGCLLAWRLLMDISRSCRCSSGRGQ